MRNKNEFRETFSRGSRAIRRPYRGSLKKSSFSRTSSNRWPTGRTYVCDQNVTRSGYLSLLLVTKAALVALRMAGGTTGVTRNIPQHGRRKVNEKDPYCYDGCVCPGVGLQHLGLCDGLCRQLLQPPHQRWL